MNRGRERVSRRVVVVNRLGLHARAAAQFVRLARSFEADIWVEKDGIRVNAKSILGLMMMAAGPGTVLRITAEGPDARRAVEALAALVGDRFGEAE